MKELKDKKYFSKQITWRFLEAMDSIIGNTTMGKVTAGEFGEKVGITGANLSRLRYSDGEHSVTLEAIGRICKEYNISSEWLIMGKGSMFAEAKNGSVIKQLKDAVAAVEISLQDASRKVTHKKMPLTKGRNK